MLSQARIRLILYLLIINNPNSDVNCAGFNSYYVPDMGIFSDHAGFAVYPIYTKTITVNIGFDNPFIGDGGMKSTCNSSDSASSKQIQDASDIMDTLMQDIQELLDPSYNQYTALFCKGIEHLCDRDGDLVPDHIDKKIGAFDNPLFRQENQVNASQESIDGMISVDASPPLRRTKRMAPILIVAALGAGIFTLGNAIYSWISMKQLSDRLTELERTSSQIEETIKEMFGVLHQFVKTTDGMYNAVRNIIPELAHKEVRTNCDIYKTKLDVFVSYAYRTREAIIRVLNAALQGTVTTEMITAKELKSVLLKDPEFSQSIYQEDLDLFYKLSMVIPLAYHRETHILSVAIAIPMVNHGDASPIYSIRNLGWISGSRIYKAIVPDTVAIVSEERESLDKLSPRNVLKQVIPLDLSKCDNRGRIYLCMHKNLELTHETSCANSLFVNNKEEIKSTCTLSSKLKTSENIKEIVPLDNFVVFRGFKSYMLQTILKNRISQPKTIFVREEDITLVKYGTFDFIQIGSSSISGKRESLSVTVKADHRINTTDIDNTDLDHLLDEDLWKTLDKDMDVLKRKEKEMERFANFDDRRMNYDKSISLVILILIVALAVIVIILYRRHNNQKQDQIEMKELVVRNINNQKRAILSLASR